MKQKEVDITFDNNGDPLIVLKSDLALKLDEVEQLNVDINFWKGFVFGICCFAIIFIIIMIAMLVIV